MKTFGGQMTQMIDINQFTMLKEEKIDLEQRNVEIQEETKRLNLELETANKSIHDKERNLRQEKK